MDSFLPLEAQGSRLNIASKKRRRQLISCSCLSAFKFLPVLGRYTADCFENTAPADIRHKWRLRKLRGGMKGAKYGDGSRGGPPLRILTREEQAKL